MILFVLHFIKGFASFRVKCLPYRDFHYLFKESKCPLTNKNASFFYYCHHTIKTEMKHFNFFFGFVLNWMCLIIIMYRKKYHPYKCCLHKIKSKHTQMHTNQQIKKANEWERERRIQRKNVAFLVKSNVIC